MDVMPSHTFRAVSYPWRLYAGVDALRHLAEEVRRHKAQRAFVVCGQTVAYKTNLLARVQDQLGMLYAGVFDAMDKDSTWPAVEKGTAAARAAGADLLIAIGGGSVIVGTRVVAILLGEKGNPFALMTQYPEGKPAYSPRLLAPKPPIINLPTTPTSAMNRAGTGLKNPALDQRMEYFDPKTRPQAIVLDEEALLGTPAEVLGSTATRVFGGLVGARAQRAANPLAEGDEDQAFRLAHRAYLRLVDEPHEPSLRLDLCLAAFLQNRAEDDGLRRFRGGAFSGNYA